MLAINDRDIGGFVLPLACAVGNTWSISLFPSNCALQAEEHVDHERDTRDTEGNQYNLFNHASTFARDVRAINLMTRD